MADTIIFLHFFFFILLLLAKRPLAGATAAGGGGDFLLKPSLSGFSVSEMQIELKDQLATLQKYYIEV